MLKQRLFLMDDLIFEEGDTEDKFQEDIDIVEGLCVDLSAERDPHLKKGLGIFFIINGQIHIIQKQSMTFITELTVSQVFGEISFFSGKPRTCTAKSKSFSELMYLSQQDFLYNIYTKHHNVVNKYENMRFELEKNPDDFSCL